MMINYKFSVLSVRVRLSVSKVVYVDCSAHRREHDSNVLPLPVRRP